MLNSKYMQRSGRFLGTARDTHVDWDEHFMIIFYDVLLLDDIVCIRESHDRRRHLLESLIHRIPGRADIGSREIIDFSSPGAPQLLSEAFARAITRRWEGVVLKGCDEPSHFTRPNHSSN
jgi:DNA ligase 4